MSLNWLHFQHSGGKIMRRLLASAGTVLLCSTFCLAQIEITLNRDFVDQMADRATISSQFRVDATSSIHPASQDGDIHVAGTADNIGLVAVAELMNAKTEKNQAVSTLKSSAGSGTKVAITGAWRIWCEHGGEQQYKQGAPVPTVESSGEAHVFEIHPMTKVNGRDVTHTWEPIAGFTYKEADQAFPTYERTRSKITFTPTTVTISTEQAGDNYTEFIAKLKEDLHALSDGKSVFVDIYDKNGELLVHRRRLILVAGTQPEQIFEGKHKGDLVQVVGIPRIDLSLVRFRVHENESHGALADSVTWNIPYELIVAAVTDESPDIEPN
jgi:hypothetical protein